MSTDIVKTDITKTVVKMRTAGKTDAGRVDMYPADLWLYEAMYGLPEIFVYLNTASHCRGTSSARTSCCSPNYKTALTKISSNTRSQKPELGYLLHPLIFVFITLTIAPVPLLDRIEKKHMAVMHT